MVPVCHVHLAYRATRKGEVKLPDAERVFNPSRQTRQILNRAAAIGTQAQALCQKLFDQRGREAQKTLWGIVGLSGRYPAWLLEQACAAALAQQGAAFKAIADRLRAEFNANAWSGRVEGGYRLIAPWIGGIGLTPYAAGQFTTFNLPAYAETVVSA